MRKKELKEELGYAQIGLDNERFINDGLRDDIRKLNEENTRLKNESRNFEFGLRLAKALGDKFVYVRQVNLTLEHDRGISALVELSGDPNAVYDFCAVLQEGA